MLNIPEDFFKEEVRHDFTITELMKRTWAAEMKVLSQLQDFFKEHNLTYYIDAGTLLGAVRHQGFIPWDDDIDIAMKRVDYMRLIELADELPYPLRLISIYNSDTYTNFHAIVSNSRSDQLEYDEERMALYFGCPFIINIDISPFDYIPREKAQFDYQKILYNIVYVLVRNYNKEYGTPKYEKDIATLERILNEKFDRSRPLLPQFTMLAEKIAMLCAEEEADHIDYFPRIMWFEKLILHDKREYEGTVMLPFECMEVAAPVLYETATRDVYGDYWIVNKGTAAHDYPFYKGQWEYFTLLAQFDERAKKLVDKYKNIGTLTE